MNHRINMAPELRQALEKMITDLPKEMRDNISKHKAKVIIIDGEIHYIDMDMKTDYSKRKR